MYSMFQDTPEVECFIYNIGLVTSGDFENHLTLLDQVLLRLEEWFSPVIPWSVYGLFSLLTTMGYYSPLQPSNHSHKKSRQLAESSVLRRLMRIHSTKPKYLYLKMLYSDTQIIVSFLEIYSDAKILPNWCPYYIEKSVNSLFIKELNTNLTFL